MTTLDFNSFEDIAVPPVFVEQISIQACSDFRIEQSNTSGILYRDRTGQIAYNIRSDGSPELQRDLEIIDLEAKLFLMVNKETLNLMREGLNVQTYMILSDDVATISLIRSGRFEFGELEALTQSGKLTYDSRPASNFLDNIQQITNQDGNSYYKLNYDFRMQTRQVSNLVCFFFTAIDIDSQTITKGKAIKKDNSLFGRIIGEAVFVDGQISKDFFYLQDQTETIWAGPSYIHTNPDGSVTYKEGLKLIDPRAKTLTRQQSKVQKIVDLRIKDTDKLFESITKNFKLTRTTSATPVTKFNSEDILIFPKSSGLSPIFSSITKQQETTGFSNTKFVSNIFFMNVLQILKDNSLYAFLLDGLEDREIDSIKKQSYIKNIKISRIPASNTSIDEETIINTSFSAGSERLQIFENRQPTQYVTSDSSTRSLILCEMEKENRFDNNFQDYRVVTFVDEISQLHRKIDFAYQVQLEIEDGIFSYTRDKFDNFKQAFYQYQLIHSALMMPAAKDNSKLDNDIALNLANFVETISFFFKAPSSQLQQIYHLYYNSINTKTGNDIDRNELLYLMEKIYLFLHDSLSILVNETVGSLDIEVKSSNKEPKSISVARISEVINTDFDESIGINYNPADASYRQINGDNRRGDMPVYMPTLTTNTLNKSATSEIKSYSISASPEQIYDRFLYHRPWSIRINKDYSIRESELGYESNSSAFLNYCASLLGLVKIHCLGSGIHAELAYTLSQQNKRMISNIDLDFHQYVTLPYSLSEIGISTTRKSKRNNKKPTTDGRININEMFEAEPVTAENSGLTDLDLLSDDMPLNFSSIIGNNILSPNKNINSSLSFRFAALSQTSKNSELNTILDERNSPYQLYTIPSFDITKPRMASYYYFKYSLIGALHRLVSFEPTTMTPTYEKFVELPANNGNKTICKFLKYVDSDFGMNSNEKLKSKVLNKYSILLGSSKSEENIKVEDIFVNRKIDKQAAINLSSLTTALYETQIRTNNQGFNLFEKLFSNSIYIEQPTEVKNTRFDFLFGSSQ